MRVRRRLLQRLEHPVRGLVVQRVGLLDDEHPPARLERRPRRCRDDRLVDVADEQARRRGRRHPRQVRVRARADPGGRALRVGRPLGQQAGGELARDVLLARARRSREQVRVRGGPGEDGGGVRMALGACQRGHATRCYVVLITIEGIDGAGKTTLAGALGERLGATVLRDPGGVALSERVRDLVKDPDLRVDPRAEALLYAAARAQLVAERVRPLLDAGQTVVLDRFVDSSLAYQGAARGLGVDVVGQINAFATGGLVPDVTLLLRLEVEQASARLGDRGEKHDRLEREGPAFYARIAAAYDDLARAHPERIRVIDASLTPGEVLDRALAAVRET